ncbi:hypothetical protein PG987_014395 [Apiospora arundinis]
MSDTPNSRPSTPIPEDRSGRADSANPQISSSKFNVGDQAWFNPNKRRNSECDIAAVRNESGGFSYQINCNVDCKERSYRSVATFLDSDENFMIYRRFGYLHSRMLLRLQDKLRALESRLDRYDSEDAADEEEKRLLMSKDRDEVACRKQAEEVPNVPTRTQILDEIEKQNAHGDADDWVLKAQQMISLNRPADRDYRSVESHMFSTKPLVDEEYRFIYQKEDLITLRDGREMAVLDSLTERLLRTFHCSLLQRELEKTDDPDVHYYSKTRKDCFNTAILCLVLISLLVLPILVLYKVLNDHPTEKSYTVSIGVLLVFVLVFSAVLSLFTKARRHEIFAAAAGYAAVLVVFFGNIS